MTAQELFTLTAGLMGITQNNALNYGDTILFQMNTILSQTFKLENNNREFLGLTKLSSIPTVSSLSDTLTYQDNVLRNVVVFGLAQLMSLSDDDVLKANFFEGRFIDAMKEESKAIRTDVEDYFSPEEDDE